MPIAILFIFGLVFGSFLNVVILRYSPGDKWLGFNKWLGTGSIRGNGGSHCMNCKKELRWHELIPVLSFLFLRRKCGECKSVISWQYPLVELLTGFSFVVPFYFMNGGLAGIYAIPNGIIWLLAFMAFWIIWFIDFRHYFIPDELVIFIALLGLANIYLKTFYQGILMFGGSFLEGYSLIFNFSNSIWINHLLGSVIATVIFGLIIILSKGRGMGMGDLKLIAALGLLMGWPDIIFAIIFSFLTGALASLYLLIRKEKTMKSHIPFGPFIILGSLITIFFGHQILDWYFSVIYIV